MLVNHYPGLFFLITLTAALPKPHGVKMDAVNTFYVLKWDWDNTQTNYTMKFTADYTYSHKKEDKKSYTKVCYRTAARQCDFTSVNLEYWNKYLLRVRAEGRGESSAWTMLFFCPDEDASLGPPSQVEVQRWDTMLGVNITEPLTAHNSSMSSIMKLSFKVEYWENQRPDQIFSTVLNFTYGTLPELKPWTLYCLRVCAFNSDYGKTSPFTGHQCVQTLGRGYPLVWQMVLVGLACLLLGTGLVSSYHKEISSFFEVYTLPSSILAPPESPMPLLQPLEESFDFLDMACDREAWADQQQEDFRLDSGIYFGEDSEANESGGSLTAA